MKIIQKQVLKENGNGSLSVEVCKIYRQGAMCKVLLKQNLAKLFLADYPFDCLLAVADENSGVILLYRITTKAEFEDAFKFANKIRPGVAEALKKVVLQ
jgi:hypothetical protein